MQIRLMRLVRFANQKILQRTDIAEKRDLASASIQSFEGIYYTPSGANQDFRVAIIIYHLAHVYHLLIMEVIIIVLSTSQLQ